MNSLETLNLDEVLYNVEYGTRIQIRKLEKLIKKYMNNKFIVLFNQVFISKKLLLNEYVYIYIFTNILCMYIYFINNFNIFYIGMNIWTRVPVVAIATNS